MTHFLGINVGHLLQSYGYWAVFVLVALESTGIPVPGETILIAAGIYAGTTHKLSVVLIIIAAAAGAILGDNLGYWVGREGGFRLLRRYGHYIHVDERKLKVGQYLFLKHGGKVVFFGRFVSILRAYAAFFAGTDQMPYPRFLAFNAAGGIPWAIIYGLGSYVLGKSINRITGPVGIGLGIAAAIVIVAFLILSWRNLQRLEEVAEKELPGPLSAHPRQRMRQGDEPPGGQEHGDTIDQDQRQDQDQRNDSSPPPPGIPAHQ